MPWKQIRNGWSSFSVCDRFRSLVWQKKKMFFPPKKMLLYGTNPYRTACLTKEEPCNRVSHTSQRCTSGTRQLMVLPCMALKRWSSPGCRYWDRTSCVPWVKSFMGCRLYLPNGGACDAIVRFVETKSWRRPLEKRNNLKKKKKNESYFLKNAESKFGDFSEFLACFLRFFWDIF